MFIEITTPTNPLRIENILHPYKRGEQPFTPEIAQQILSSTNYPRSIRDMLNLIADLPTSEQAQYKDLVLAAFDHREQPNDVTIIGKKLALANNYEDELNQTINHDPTTDKQNGITYAPAINEVTAYICADENPDLSEYPPNVPIYCTNDTVDLSYTDLSTVKNLKFKEESNVHLYWVENLPADLDVSMCSKVNLSNSNLSTVKNLKFKNGSSVDLSHCTNLPEDLDISMCDSVDLSFTDLSTVKNLKFKEGSTVHLCGCLNLPEDLDLSMCDEVNLSFTNLSTVKNLKFKEGSKVNLSSCLNLPEDLDVSMCDEVNLSSNDLSTVKNLKFKEGGTVYLRESINLPENLDVSMCSEVILSNTNLYTVKTLTFKNKTQQNESRIEIPKDWQGKIVYTEEMPTNSTFRFQTSNTR